ncbi:hypothetical protein Pla52n_51890 [Stieleria varia]|uniref:Uncharacterized protein n=1 Tax=Stieleria varia TaxID=2528005 RepID=A0A5C6AF67_9BACT|nr:hypothetical protein Pla52n_51890 [Stieleria varia]
MRDRPVNITPVPFSSPNVSDSDGEKWTIAE